MSEEIQGSTKRGAIINGRYIQGQEFLDYCEKNGMCTLCGKARVKEKKSVIFGRAWSDIPIVSNRRGEIEVYKGYHISPMCYSLAQAKETLGEIDEPTPRRPKKPKKPRNRVQNPLTPSDRQRPEQTENRALVDPDSDPYLPLDVIDAEVKPAEVTPASVTSDDVTHNSGGSSSQEHQTSTTSSGNELRAESPSNCARMPDHQSPSQNDVTGVSHRFDLMHLGTPQAGHGAGHFRSASSDSEVASALEKRRRALVNSDPPRQWNARSLGDIHLQSPSDTVHRSTWNTAHLPTIPSIVETPDKAAIRDVEVEAERLDVYQFLIQLDCHRAKLEVVRKGLQLMRELVFKIHQSRPETRYVFPNDSWCKTIKSAMTEHEQDDNVQEEGAMTITFVCSVSTKYKADLIRNHNSKEIITAMETHPSAQEACCVALECLTLTEGARAGWREEHAATAFEGLRVLLSDSSHSGTSYAILALHNLTCHENLRPEFVVDHMRVIFADNSVVGTIASVMQGDSVSEEVIKAAVSLLRRFWMRFMNDSTETPSCDALLGALMGAIYSYGSESFHEGACGLLTSVKIPVSTDISWKQTLSDAVLHSMTSHTMVESVQLMGLSALCNIFGDSSRREEYVADLDRIVEAIIFSMNNFDRNPDIQAQGCLALACICSSGDWYKEAVVRKGGIAVVANALRSHAVNIDSNMPSAAADGVKVAACSALASLSLCSAAVSELRSSKLLVDFRTMIKRNGLSAEQPCVRTCVINLISASLAEEVSNGRGGPSPHDESEYTFLAEIATQLLSQSLAEEDVQSLLASLNAMCTRASSVLDVILLANDGAGTGRVADLLEEYANNAYIQEAGCAILGNIYFQVPFEGELDQSSFRSVGPNSVHVKTHSHHEISVMRTALENHKGSAHVVKNACEALCNFICGLNVVSPDPDNVHIPEGVAVLFSGIPRETDSAMAIHGDNPEVMKSVLRLVLVTSRLLGDDEMQRYSANLIARIFETMLRFPHDEEIHRCACSILGRFVSLENDSIDASTANAEGLRALLLSLQMENEAVVSCAIGVISSLLQRVFSFSNDILEIEEYIDCFIGCMHRFQESVNIQAETCSILASLATLNDPFVKMIIANEGGVTAVLFAMRSHRNQAYVLEYGCKALGSIAEGIPDEILLSFRETICGDLLRALNTYSNMEGVVGATLEALCEFCRRDEYFELQIVGGDAVRTIVDSMSRHLGLEDVQNAGCKLLWLLACKNDENKQVLGTAGAIQALVSAMLAHIGSTAIQKEALTALKHVARVSANKEALERNHATDAIRLTIYANLGEPLVISAALSALNDIAVDTTTCEVNPVADETMSCVLRAMQIHSPELEVQKIACWLLRSYTFNERNLALMRFSREELLRLLIAASTAFPEECGERAQSILEKL